MPCSYCGVGGHGIDHCPERLEDKFADSREFESDGARKVSLRDGETRDDDNTHAQRNEAQLAIAEKELEDTEDDNEH